MEIDLIVQRGYGEELEISLSSIKGLSQEMDFCGLSIERYYLRFLD